MSTPAGHPVWQGRPSGEAFAGLLSERAVGLGLPVDVAVMPHLVAGVYAVGVEWGPNNGDSVLYEVSDPVNGVRVLDPDGEDVSVQQGVDYFEARARGDRSGAARRSVRRASVTAARCDAARRAGLSYNEVGATASGALPSDFRHLYRSKVIGAGRDRFEQVAERLMSWEVHRAAGLAVEASAERAALGVVVLVGVGWWRLVSPCLVVSVVDTQDRRGFAYGTLHGHAETGEELFLVRRHEDDTVRCEISAFSRPATWWARAAGPAARWAQDRITDRHVAALAAA